MCGAAVKVRVDFGAETSSGISTDSGCECSITIILPTMWSAENKPFSDEVSLVLLVANGVNCFIGVNISRIVVERISLTLNNRDRYSMVNVKVCV